MQILNVDTVRRKPIGIFFFGMLVALVFFTVIMPNSFQVATAIVMFGSAFVCLFYISKTDISSRFLIFLYLSFCVTLLYLVVGVMNLAPNKAVLQVFYIYMVSPFLWFVILTFLIVHFGDKKIINFFIPIAWVCCFSCFVFFYLFEKYGSKSVSLFIENANLNTKDGYSGATMHVYGSLVFLAGGFFSAPEVIKNKILMVLTLIILSIAAVTSGRTALIVSIFIGLFVFLFFSSGSNSIKVKIGFVFSLLLVVITVIYISSFFRGIDFFYVMNVVTDKVFSGGGIERTVQTEKLIESFSNSYGLGVGHGVGIDYIRNPDFPWRYETIWIATLHRVGFLGALIYFMPFAVYLVLTFFKLFKCGLNLSERFFLGAFLCAFAASNTNPYLEGVTFQWMYVFPVLAFFLRNRELGFYK